MMKKHLFLLILSSISLLNGMDGAGSSTNQPSASNGYVPVASAAPMEQPRIDAQTAYEIFCEAKEPEVELARLLSLGANRNELIRIAQENNNETLLNLFKTMDDHLRGQAAQGNNDAVLSLLQQRADPRTQDAQGRTALHHAALNGHAPVVERLIQWLLEERTITLGRAAQDVQNQLTNVALVNLEDIFRVQDAEGRTAFHLAAMNGNRETLDMLLKMFEEVFKKTRQEIIGYGTASDTAWKVGRRLLNGRDQQGRTALHLAALSGHEEAVNWLLEHDVRNVNDNQVRSAQALVEAYTTQSSTSKGKGKKQDDAEGQKTEADMQLMRHDEGAPAAYERIRARLAQAFQPRSETQPAPSRSSTNPSPVHSSHSDELVAEQKPSDQKKEVKPQEEVAATHTAPAPVVRTSVQQPQPQPASVIAPRVRTQAPPVQVMAAPAQNPAEIAAQLAAVREAQAARYRAQRNGGQPRGGEPQQTQNNQHQEEVRGEQGSGWLHSICCGLLAGLFSWESHRAQGPK